MTSNRWQWDNENIYGETQEHIAPYAPLGAMRNNDDYDDRNIYVFLLAFIVYVYPYQHTRLFFFFYTHLRYLCLCHKSRVSLGKVRKIFTFIF